MLTFTHLVGASLSLGLAGTAPDTSIPAENPYRVEFEQALAASTSPFESGVLADGIITADEYGQAVARYLECVREAGYPMTTRPDPLMPFKFTYEVDSPDIDFGALIDDTEACAEGTTRRIEALYGAIIMNPDNLDWDEVTVECLRDEELVDDDFVADQIGELLESTDSGADFDPYDDMWTDAERMTACTVNPLLVGLDFDVHTVTTR